ncbi:hypothetical protein [Ammoniphilus sp. 3BR4]
MMDLCISCETELASFERNRTECFDCRDKACESYSDEDTDYSE